MARTIRVAQTESGAFAYFVPVPPESLPAVAPADLLRAWTVARHGAVQSQWGAARFLRFARRDDAGPTEIAISDPDAGAWTEAIDRAFGLDTLFGLSLCLRLLALVDVLARVAQLGPFFDVTPAGVDLHPSLLAAAAALPLDREARLDGAALVERLRPKALPTGGDANPARLP